jgi:GNAT superfamily N-acetyltransferase
MSIEVRPAVADDARAIAEVHVASWRAAYDGLIADEVLAGLSVDDRADYWATVTDGAGGVAVAIADGTLAGFTAIGPNRDQDLSDEVGELYAIYLDPARWSTGVGHALHEAAIADLAGRGYRTACLWVLDGNARAIGFYERHGWVADGATKTDDRGAYALHERRFLRLL